MSPSRSLKIHKYFYESKLCCNIIEFYVYYNIIPFNCREN